ncbi:uncharacterized protein LOC112588886 [Harpegnathos saltator]|uniref:uncharacterized protein LOC112588886 n=1 Tax=Harpegnathos saltator TaxID=610380 RepID=UPI000DBEF130|nr:uncharacterized protein LOC112588886 [Harpegnathos saltator]
MRQALKVVAVRAVQGFRSIAYMAATTLVGSPPVELLAEERCILYWGTKELRERGEATARELSALKSHVVARTLQKWEDAMFDPREFGQLTMTAVRPCLAEFAGRRGRGLTYHLVQVMTGHGCFGQYLHRIKKEPITECHHCPELDDTAHHTLSECPAWDRERGVQARAVGCRDNEVTLPCMTNQINKSSSRDILILNMESNGGHMEKVKEDIQH